MKSKLLLKFSISLGLFLFCTATSASAKTEIDFDNKQPIRRTIKEGNIKLKINHFPKKKEDLNSKNLEYKILFKGDKKIGQKVSTFYGGRVLLYDLDNNGYSEAIISTYTGGAHCCTEFRIYSWNGDKFLTKKTGMLDASGGNFSDLNGDGKVEFLTNDNSFLYKFSSYAGSFPPTLIFNFSNGNFKNTTKQHPGKLKETAWQMYKAVLGSQKEDREVNGVLAGYVAQKILLGEFNEGWNFMLEHYNTDWSSDEYSSFPIALKDFLIERGYLNREGKPTDNINISL